MNTAVLPEYRDLLALRPLVREATALGARFRLSGAAVEIAGGANLPLTLRQELARYEESGLLCIYLDTKGAEQAALDLGEQLGVYALLIEERYEARIAVRDLMEDMQRHGGHLGVDIETAALPEYDNRPWITLNKDGTPSARQPTEEDEDAIPAALYPHLAAIGTLQLYAGGRTCYVLRNEALQMVLRSNWFHRLHLVAHNATFEAAFLQHHCNGYHLPAGRKQHFRFRLECTQQASGLLLGVGYGGEARKLDKVAKRVLKLDVPKELATSNWTAKELSPGQTQYAASDAIIAWRLWSKAEPALHKSQRWDAYELQRRVIPAVADMELRGLGFDRARHREKVSVWARELAQARQEYLDITKKEPPSKPAQVREWLADVLTPERLARWPRTPMGLLSTKSEHLQRLGDIASTRPVLTLLAKEKLLSTFGADFAAKVNPVTHRLHTHYQIAGTKAGRFSASGPNLQQLPQTADPTFKECIVAAQGNLLIGGDYSQVELRGAAFISKDRNMTMGFAAGRDLHKETAAKIARVAVEEVSAAQRQAAKPVNFGAIYGIGAASLAANAFADYGIEMTVSEADQALKAFFAFFYGYDDWRWDHYHLCQRRGYVLIDAGRIVAASWEPGRKLSFPQSCNLVIQGAAANCMMRLIILLYARLKASAIRGGMVATIHDELLLEVPEDDAEATRALLAETMIEAFELTYPGAPIVNLVETKIGRSWADVK
jgi:DNA polymerase-1